MKPSNLLERVRLQREKGEKGEILKGLSALLLVTPSTQPKARSYIEKAISFIEQK